MAQNVPTLNIFAIETLNDFAIEIIFLKNHSL